MSRFPQCEGMLEEDPFATGENPETNDDLDSDSDDTENAGFVERGDGTSNGPQTVGAGPEEPLIEEPEEPEETEQLTEEPEKGEA